MKTACVLTTINVPKVLALYAKHGPDVTFFIIGDRKTPNDEVAAFLSQNDINGTYYPIEAQYKLGWKCASLIPENCIQRRNVGFLEALKWGADIVVSIDDDNIPLNWQVSWPFELSAGLKVISSSAWFDVGQLLLPPASHRGFPYTKKASLVFESIVDAKIGVAAGICLGDPDIDATTRIVNAPIVHGVSELLRAGVVVDPRETWTVFNSQNTAVIRELVPAWFMLPGVGRFDDIYASLIVQRVMRETGHCVHFGQPFVWQQRNQHDLIKDLKDEIEGMERVVYFSKFLDEAVLDAESLLDNLNFIYRTLDVPQRMISGMAMQAAIAWLDDCKRAMQ